MVVANAGNAETDGAHMQALAKHFNCVVEPLDRVFLAIQGPEAEAVLRDAGVDPGALVFMNGVEPRENWFMSRSGYTGEDGFEIVLPEAQAVALWNRLADAGVAPAGLGARDTLRLEAGMNLYGQDMDESVTPWEANLGWTVALDEGRDFIGRAALEAQKARGDHRVMVGLVMDAKGVLRHGQRVITPDGDGEILSGSFSPTLGKSIAFARVPRAPGADLHADIRGKPVPVRVVKYPFVRDGKACEGM